jgi:hypothetical protein
MEHHKKSSIFQSIELATSEPGGSLRVFSFLMSIDRSIPEQLRDRKRPVLYAEDEETACSDSSWQNQPGY